MRNLRDPGGGRDFPGRFLEVSGCTLVSRSFHLLTFPFTLFSSRLLISAITRAAAWTGARRVFLCPPEESVTPPPLRRSSAPPRDQGERKLVQHENKCRRKTRSERVRKKKTTGNLRVAIRPPAVRVMRCHPRAACACIAQHLWKDGRDEEVLEGWKSVFEGFG